MTSENKQTEKSVNSPGTYSERTLLSVSGNALQGYYWKPTVPLRALVFLCHGFGEHLQWYEEVAHRLNSHGFFCFGHDHVGFGRSEGMRAWVESEDVYVDDVIQHTKDVRKDHSDLPVFILGHSMGGWISILTGLKQPDLYRGFLLMGPLIKLDPDLSTPFRRFMGKMLVNLFPKLPLISLDPSVITRDQTVVDRLKKDPLRYAGGPKLKHSVIIIYSLEYLETKLSSIKWPFFIQHAGHDKLCSLEGSQKLFNESPSKDKSMKVYEGAYHHLFLELQETRQQVFQDLTDWLLERLDKPSF